VTAKPSSIGTHLRTGALVLCAWLALTLLMGAVSMSIDAPPPAQRVAWTAMNAMIAVLWSAFSLVIAAWHRRARESTRRLWILVALHVPLLVLVSLGDALAVRVAAQLISGLPLRLPFAATVVYYADFDIVRYVVIVAVAEALLLRRTVAARQRHATHIETLLARARLDHLEAQLQPHFLFNALGTVSELAFRSPGQAAHVVRQLAAITRESASQTTDEIPLGAELAGMEPYLEIQRLRFADWLTIDFDVSPATMDCLVPRLVLQPLVENAIRHGLSGRRAAGAIRIEARTEQGMLIVRVADNGVGVRPGAGESGHRIGLANVRDRLSILYGDDNRLRLSNGDIGGAVAELTIPARRRATVRATDNPSEPSDPADQQLDGVWSPSLPPIVARRPWLTTVVLWLACGALWFQQSLLYYVMRGRASQVRWVPIAASDMINGLLWAAITPLVFILVRRFALERRWLAARVAAYIVAAAALSLLHATVLERLTNPSVPVWSDAYEMTLVVDFVIVFALVAIAHRRQFVDWLDTREASAAALGAQLALARHRATRLQSISPVLLQSLEQISVLLEANPERTEGAISSLADYLRLAIESSDTIGITPPRERALARALAELEQSVGVPLSLSGVA
jgi:two-component system LytT family sensor kinase